MDDQAIRHHRRDASADVAHRQGAIGAPGEGPLGCLDLAGDRGPSASVSVPEELAEPSTASGNDHGWMPVTGVSSARATAAAVAIRTRVD